MVFAAPLLGGLVLWWPWYLLTGGGPLRWIGVGKYMVMPFRGTPVPPDMQAYMRSSTMEMAARVAAERRGPIS